MSGFWKGFLGTAVPITALALLSTRGDAYASNLVWLWLGGAIAGVGAVGALTGFYLAGKDKVSLGILAALPFAGLALSLTCFANLYEGF